MASELRLRRGTDAENAAKTAAEGELLYTTDTKRLYIHDGSTAGGTRVANYVDIPTTTGAQPNLVIGGNFSTNPWQRGTSFSSPATDDYTADRYQWQINGTGDVDVLRATDAPTAAEAGISSSHCLHVDVTTADASITAGDFYFIRHNMEGYDWQQLSESEFTITFWHKHTKTGTYCVGLRNTALSRSYVAEYTQSVSDTWEQAEITVSASPTTGFDFTNGTGVQLCFTLAAGSTFQTTADSWNSTNAVATANQVNAMDSTSNNFKIQFIDVKKGDTATGFSPRPIQEELDLCYRYYYRQSQATQGDFLAVGQCIDTDTAQATLYYPVEMRDDPSVSISGSGGIRISNASGTQAASTAVSFALPGTKTVRLSADRTGSGLVAGNASIMLIDSGDYIEYDAEL